MKECLCKFVQYGLTSAIIFDHMVVAFSKME